MTRQLSLLVTQKMDYLGMTHPEQLQAIIWSFS